MNPVDRANGFWPKAVIRPLAIWAIVLLAPPSYAGQFSVSPIRIDLDRKSRSDSITISNDETARTIQMRAKLVEWTQDPAGNDVYRDSDDLIFFPRIFSIQKQEQQVIRLGWKAPPGATEKSYRLFLEELPQSAGGDAKPAQVLFLVRFGVPVFVRPDTENFAGAIAALQATENGISVSVRNSGNQNFQIQSLLIRSGHGYEKEIVGGYVLAVSTKVISTAISYEVCTKLNRIDVVLKTDRIGTIERSFDWNPTDCVGK
ncbi:MAG: molecular chaperone [Burkholderiaceae bacterium]|nr:molecular chaperone [Burkholderiaceae bacterium]